MSTFRELQQLEKDLRSIKEDFQEEQQQALQSHLNEREPLLTRRYELVTGHSSPSSEELKGFQQQPGGPADGVPGFWLHALAAQESISKTITEDDKAALAYVEDVRYLRGAGGMLVEFHFKVNPFFTNKVLRRGLNVLRDGMGNVSVTEEATPIDWHDDCSLLVRKVKISSKKGKKQGGRNRKNNKGGSKKSKVDDDDHDKEDVGEEEEGEDGGAMYRVKPVPSFFRFFTPLQRPKVYDPTAEDDDDDHDDEHLLEHDDVQDDEVATHFEVDSDGEVMAVQEDRKKAAIRKKAERDMATLEHIVRKVVPRAAELYLQALQGDSDEPEIETADSDDFQVIKSKGKGKAHSKKGGESSNSKPMKPDPKLLHALKHNQAQIDACASRYKEARWKLGQEQDGRLQELLAQRTELLMRTPRAVRGFKQCSPQPMTTTLPLFWLKLFRHVDGTANAVSLRDELALASLADVKVKWDWSHMPTKDEPWRKVTLEFTFLDNPYFKACTITRSYTLGCHNGAMNQLFMQSSGSSPQGAPWRCPGKPPRGTTGNEEGEGEEEEEDLGVPPGVPGGCDLTVAGLTKKGKPEPSVSFFNLFKPDHLIHAFTELEGEGKAALKSALGAEQELLNVLLGDTFTYTASQIYDQTDIDEEDLGHEYNTHFGDEEDDEDDDLMSDEDGQGNGGDGQAGNASRRAAAAASKAARRRRHHEGDQEEGGSGGGLFSKQNILLVMLLLMVLAQAVSYFEMWFGGGRR